MTTLIYDSSFEGFLTAVFNCYDEKTPNVEIIPQHQYRQSFFSTPITIITNNEKADRVWNGLKTKLSKAELSKFYYAFLSETNSVENTLYKAIQYIFNNKQNVGSDYTNEHILTTSKLAKSVSREKHRMKAFIRFKLTHDNVYFANIHPDFNVLPLIITHFKNRYADQQWIIYDLARQYGMYYDLSKIETITLNFASDYDPTKTSKEIFTDTEIEFQSLWKDYFTSTNIQERKNTKLHVQHVPKRYWKYLSEKQP